MNTRDVALTDGVPSTLPWNLNYELFLTQLKPYLVVSVVVFSIFWLGLHRWSHFRKVLLSSFSFEWSHFRVSSAY